MGRSSPSAPASLLVLLACTSANAQREGMTERAAPAAVAPAVPPAPERLEVRFAKPATLSPGPWTLRDARGELVCELPCNHRLGPSDGFYVWGPSDEGMRRYAIRADFRGLTAASAPEARLVPRKGDPRGPVILAIASGVLVLGGGVLVGTVLVPRHYCDASECSGGSGADALLAIFFAGVGATALGLAGETAAIVWNANNEKERFVTAPDSPSRAASPRTDPLVRITVSPFGLRGTF